jgi:hypothetical protein
MGDTVGFSRELFVDRDDVHGYPLLGHLQYRLPQESCQEKSSTVN